MLMLMLMLMLALVLVIEIPLANAQRSTPNVQLQRGGIQPEWPKFSSLDVRQWFAHYS